MTVAAHLSALYSAAPVVLWVEDGLTRDYLAKVWGDPADIAFLIAGNGTAIAPTLEAAWREGVGHVFGLVDRDFGFDNRAKWVQPEVRRFYLPRHEIENYLIDADAVEGGSLHNRKRTRAGVEAEIHRLATMQPSWLACRRVLWDMRRDTQGDFPAHPLLGAVASLAQAEAAITTSAWYAALTARAQSWTTPGRIGGDLAAAEGGYQADLGSGEWKKTFSGKEVFRRLRDYAYQPPQQPGSPDSDFAKAVGEWQYDNNAVPADLTDLLAALRSKILARP